MSSDDPRMPDDLAPGRASEVDEFLSRAVDRQIAEQRALREALTQLTDAVNAMARQRPSADPDDLSDRMLAASRSAVEPILSEMRVLNDSMLSAQKSVSAPAVPGPDAQQLAALHRSVSGVSADIEGIAQALIDLNAGLRDWAEGVDRNISSVRTTLQEIRDLAARTQDLQSAALERTGSHAAIHPDDDYDEAAASPGPSIDHGAEIEKRIKETVELSLYLADQIEDFDKVLREMGDLPSRLEGVVSQGIRRTLAARAKLDAEASTAMDDTLDALDGHVERMSETVERFAAGEETLRKLGLGQAELANRLDSVYDAVLGSEPKQRRQPRPSQAKATGSRAKSKPTKTRGKKSKPADDTSAD